MLNCREVTQRPCCGSHWLRAGVGVPPLQDFQRPLRGATCGSFSGKILVEQRQCLHRKHQNHRKIHRKIHKKIWKIMGKQWEHHRKMEIYSPVSSAPWLAGEPPNPMELISLGKSHISMTMVHFPSSHV